VVELCLKKAGPTPTCHCYLDVPATEKVKPLDSMYSNFDIRVLKGSFKNSESTTYERCVDEQKI